MSRNTENTQSGFKASVDSYKRCAYLLINISSIYGVLYMIFLKN